MQGSVWSTDRNHQTGSRADRTARLAREGRQRPLQGSEEAKPQLEQKAARGLLKGFEGRSGKLMLFHMKILLQ